LAGNLSDPDINDRPNFTGGTLYLNVGKRSYLRNEAEEEENEGYVIRRIGDDKDYGGEIIEIEGFGRKQNFRGVKKIVGDFDYGYNYVEIESGLKAEVHLIGGSGRDWLLHNGRGDAILDAGLGDDVIQGGLGNNRFIYRDSFGRDEISSLGVNNSFDLSPMTESTSGKLTSRRLLMTPSGYNRLWFGKGMIDGHEVIMLPNGSRQMTLLYPSHPFTSGDRIRLKGTPDGAHDREYFIERAEADTLLVSSFDPNRPAPTGSVGISCQNLSRRRQHRLPSPESEPRR
jgi:hypothetical protein